MLLDPSVLYCPISHSIFLEPVTMPEDGYTYEKYEILKWLAEHSTSPMTREPIQIKNVYENVLVKELVRNYLSMHPEKKHDQYVYPSIRIEIPPQIENGSVSDTTSGDTSMSDEYELRRIVFVHRDYPLLRFASGALAGCVVGVVVVLLYGWLYGFIAVVSFSIVFTALTQKCS